MENVYKFFMFIFLITLVVSLTLPCIETKTIEESISTVTHIKEGIYLIEFDDGEQIKIEISDNFVDFTDESVFIFDLVLIKFGLFSEYGDIWKAVSIVKINR